jgi:peptide/nickel transport system ATP-binding protein
MGHICLPIDQSKGQMGNTMMAGKLLDVQGLKMYINSWGGVVKAVDGVDIEINDNEIVGIVGESGCGKSMTALSIMGLLPPGNKIMGGKILFKDNDLLKLTEAEINNIRGKDISFVFQNPSTFLNPVLRIGDQITESVMVHQGKSKKEARKDVIHVLNRVGIPSPDVLYRYYPHQMSGGMRQRTMIAMALSCKPSLLIADECTTELDVTTQLQILQNLKELVMTGGFSLLLITHDLGVVAYMCNRVYVMYAGRTVETANINDLFEHPKHPYTVGLLESSLSTEGFTDKLVSIKGSVPNLINPPSGCRFHPRCPKVMDKCREIIPERTIIEERHIVSCLLYN